MKKYLLLLVSCLAFLHLQAQINRYVSPAGFNTNIGTLASPWKTLQYAINTASINDTINLLAGTYNEKITVNKSGLYIRNYLGAVVILSGTGVSSPVAMIQVTDKTDITIDGLEIANNARTDAQGILLEGTCKRVTIQNCKIHDIHFSTNPNASVNSGTNAQGIIVYGTHASIAMNDIRILNNELYNCRLGYSEGIAVNGNIDGFEITGNTVHDLTNIGIDAIGHEGTSSSAGNDQARNGIIKNNIVYKCVSPYATSGGIYVDGGKNIIIENNTSYHNGYGIEIGCENIGKTTDSIVVRNNIFYDNEICAIAVGGYDYPSGSGKVTRAIIRNNSCLKDDYSNNGTGELYLTYSENSVIENNIFYLSGQNILAYAELGQPSLSFNYNVIYSENDPVNMEAGWNGKDYGSFAAFKTGTSTNANSIVGNPQFAGTNIASPNLHIAVNSIAKEAGNPAFVAALLERDIDNEQRISGIVDCGADEYYSNQVIEYRFTGNGNWNVASNWSNSSIPPAILTGNAKIIIDPSANGECVLNIEQHIGNAVEFIIMTGKKFRIAGNLSLHHD